MSLISLIFFPDEAQMLKFQLFQATKIKMKPKNGLSCRDIRVSGKKKKRMGATPIFFSVDNIGKKKKMKKYARITGV